MKVAIASGKGGTGKTTVASNLASVARISQFVDCDVECPNSNNFLEPQIKHYHSVNEELPKILDARCTACGECATACQFNAIAVIKDTAVLFPRLCVYCGACKMVCPERAIKEETIKIGEIQKGKFGPNHSYISGKLELTEIETVRIIKEIKDLLTPHPFTVIDCPPGCSHPAITAMDDSDYILLVAEPTPFGLKDLKLTLEVTGDMDIPQGVVINKVGMGNSDLEDFCRENELPILAKIPNDKNLKHLYSQGKLITNQEQYFENIFKSLYERIKDENNNRN